MKHKTEDIRADRVGQVKITFTGKELTAWGGACSVVAKFLEQIEFRQWVETNVPVEEHSPNAKGIYPKVLSLFLTCAAGGTRFSDIGSWMHGRKVVAACFGVKWLPRAASVLTRFLGKFRRLHVERLRESSCKLARRLLEEEAVAEDELVLDSTVCTRYGEQEGAKKGYNPSKPGRPSHHPLKASLSCGYVVNLWNRSGNVHTAHQVAGFFDQTCRGLPRALKIRRVLADSGFCDNGFLAHLESEGRRYIVAMRLSDYVKAAIRQIAEWTAVAPGIEMAEARVCLSTWDKARRMVFVRQHVPTLPRATGKQPTLFEDLEDHRDYRYGAMVTNEEDLSMLEVWRTYRPRAKIENVIKELKEGYGWHEFNVRSFWGTEAGMLLIGMVFHNLIHHLNRRVLKTEAEGVCRLKKIRLKVLAIPALYGSGGRMPVLRLGVRDPRMRARIRYWLQRICRLELRLPNGNAFGSPPAVQA